MENSKGIMVITACLIAVILGIGYAAWGNHFRAKNFENKQGNLEIKSFELSDNISKNHEIKSDDKELNIMISLAYSQILGETPKTWLETYEESFENLPAICKKGYDSNLQEERKAKTTQVAYIDLNGDNINEIISWDGTAGSGGLGWNIISNNQIIDNVFGSIILLKNQKQTGLLIHWAMGINDGTWDYWQLKNKK